MLAEITKIVMTKSGGRIAPFLWPLLLFAATAGFYWFLWLRSSIQTSELPAQRRQKLAAGILSALVTYVIYCVALVLWFLNSPPGTFNAWLEYSTGDAVYGHLGLYIAVIGGNAVFCAVHAVVLLSLGDALRDAGLQRSPAPWTTITFNVLLATENLPYLGFGVAMVGGILWIWWYLRVQSIFLTEFAG